VAQALHDARALDSETRTALAAYMEELSKAIESEATPSSDLTHLAETTRHLLEAAKRQKPDIPDDVRSRFENATLRVQNQFPTVAAMARTLVDALANIGI